ncbi:MAG: SDR family oxidoreductase [Alphaproteobacteria bacterium]|nr:SDR family oxidoreductase [Alphaproteobacteria bacterium]
MGGRTVGALDGRTILITGAASGIGRATAIAAAAAGASVLTTDIDEDGGHEIAAQVGGRFLHQDVTDEARWQEVAAAAGPLQGLVNNAGIAIVRPLLETSLEDWRKQQAVNVEGVFLGVKHILPVIRDAGGGAIVNLSSVAGLRGNSVGLSCYSATKGAVRLFTKSAALESARRGWNVRVNSVHPGIIDTPIWDRMAESGPSLFNDSNASTDPVQRASSRVPGGRPGGPENIADAIIFLLSDASSYMTGSELVIDHGMTAGT